MQRTMKRVGALILALAMLVTFMPMLGLPENAHADEEEGITVYLTISDKGVIAKDNDGKAMAWREVEVTDSNNDGKYSFDEALVAAHEKYNSADGYAGGSAGWVTKLWGVETGSSSFTNNDEPTDVVNEAPVEEGDYLVASINSDGVLYSDWASFFDKKEITVKTGEDFNLSLYGFGAMTTDDATSIEDAQVGIWENGVVEPIEDAITDEDGDTYLSFDEPGEYILTAQGKAECNAWLVDTEEVDKDNQPIFGRMDYNTSEYYAGFTDEDYGDGPYPLDEIKWVNIDDDSFDINNYSDAHFIHSSSILAPIIAPCCVVNVVDACDVNITVNNQGVLASDEDGDAMANREVTVYDLDGDREFTVEEALIAAHKQYYKDGEDGYAYGDLGTYSAVTKLWGIETTNTLFLVNSEPFSDSVKEAKIEDGDKLYASVNSDNVNWADYYAEFDDTYPDSVKQNEDITVHLTGFLGMGQGDALESKDLEGVQIGYWEDGKFVAIPGAVTDKNGEATFFLDEEDDYIITAKGTVKGKDWQGNDIDCPIMAPYCFLEVEKASSTSAFDKKKADAFSELFDTFDPAKYRSKDQMKVLSLLVKAQSQISAANTTADITKAVDAAKAELKKITTDAQYKKQEAAFKKLKIKGVKAKAGKKKVTVTWKKAKVSGYEIVCKAGKTKKAVIKKAATVKKVIKGLTSKKKCTTKIRGFKTIGGKKVYTAWAKAKTVKIK